MIIQQMLKNKRKFVKVYVEPEPYNKLKQILLRKRNQ